MKKLNSILMVIVGMIGIALVMYTVNKTNEILTEDYIATVFFALITAVGIIDLWVKPFLNKTLES